MDGDRRGPGGLMEQLGEIKQGGSPRCPPPKLAGSDCLLGQLRPAVHSELLKVQGRDARIRGGRVFWWVNQSLEGT